MKIPRYWKQVFKHVDGINFHQDHCKFNRDNGADIYAWGYSDTSEENALRRAESRIDQIVVALTSGYDEDFYYPMNVLREDILQDLSTDAEGQALVTRNRYFSQVLNSDKLMFIDIDVSDWDIKPPTFWQRLFGKAAEIEAKNNIAIKQRFNEALDLVYKYVKEQPDVGFLIYRTFAGFRLIASHKTYDPNSQETQQVFDALGTDPLYQKLCSVQECFRARLTPKFWRLNKELGITPSIKFRINESIMAKWSDGDKTRTNNYDEWVNNYETQHISHATCRFIKQIGNLNIAPELEFLINYHDQKTQAHSGKPLA